MEIPFSGQIDVDILRRTNRAALTPTRGRLLFIGLVVLFAGWGVVAPVFNGGAIAWESLAPLLIVLPLFAGMIAYALYAGPRKLLASNRLLQSPISGVASEAGMRVETAHSRSELPWDVFLRRTIGEDIILLYQSAQGANAFPREFFASEGDWQAFVELVRQHVPERAPAGRGGRLVTLKVFVLWLVVFVIVILVWSYFH